MKIFAIDVMSGDNEPEELIQGCIDSLKKIPDIKIIIVGEKEKIQNVLLKKKVKDDVLDRLSIEDSDSIIEMDEHPAVACRKKKGSTVMVGTRLLKENKANAFFSPGNTGASLAASLYVLGRIKGVKRPAIGVFIPTKKKTKALLLDAGANMDCAPKYLKQFAIMGVEYYKIFFNKKDTDFGQLNIGTETEKGNDLALSAYKHLNELPYLFRGNVEPKIIMEGNCDVVVCDGFVGNIFLKTCEMTALTTLSYFKRALKEKLIYKMGVFFLKGKFKEIKNDFDPSEIGCAPLLGVDGNVFIGHGGSNSKSVLSAIETMLRCIEKKPLDIIRESIKNYG